MADEITVSISASVNTTASGSFSTPRLAFQADLAETNIVGGGTQDVGTSAELVTFGDMAAAPAMLVIKNLDTANYIELGGDSGLTVFKLKVVAGEAILVRLSSATLYAKANTASVRIQKWAA